MRCLPENRPSFSRFSSFLTHSLHSLTALVEAPFSKMSSTPVDPALQDFIAENYPSAELFEEPAGVSLPSIREQVAETEGSQICRNWVRSLRTHRSGLHAGPMRFVYNWPDDETQDECYRVYNERLMRDDVSIETSASFLHKVKSIGSSVKSMSMLSLSTFRRSRSNTQTSSRCRGSTFSGSDPPRSSIDSSNLSTIVYINDTGLKYCLERHRIIDEIITTEISYMSMLRNLSQVRPLSSVV